jgi:hypothetical protein
MNNVCTKRAFGGTSPSETRRSLPGAARKPRALVTGDAGERCPPTPSPSPIDVFVHNAPAADWQVWAAFAPLIAAVIAVIIAFVALWQGCRADNRVEWWRRAQWALDATMSDGPKRAEMPAEESAEAVA